LVFQTNPDQFSLRFSALSEELETVSRSPANFLSASYMHQAYPESGQAMAHGDTAPDKSLVEKRGDPLSS
jgi:hypothetical protein